MILCDRLIISDSIPPTNPPPLEEGQGGAKKGRPTFPSGKYAAQSLNRSEMWNMSLHLNLATAGWMRITNPFLDLNYNAEIGIGRIFFAGHFQNLNTHVWQGSTSCSILPSRMHVGWENMEKVEKVNQMT